MLLYSFAEDMIRHVLLLPWLTRCGLCVSMGYYDQTSTEYPREITFAPTTITYDDDSGATEDSEPGGNQTWAPIGILWPIGLGLICVAIFQAKLLKCCRRYCCQNRPCKQRFSESSESPSEGQSDPDRSPSISIGSMRTNPGSYSISAPPSGRSSPDEPPSYAQTHGIYWISSPSDPQLSTSELSSSVIGVGTRTESYRVSEPSRGRSLPDAPPPYTQIYGTGLSPPEIPPPSYADVANMDNYG